MYKELKEKDTMEYSLDKYKFYFDEKNATVIAVSTYAGKTVKGYAKCDPRDQFDKEAGMKLAAARCNERIAKKRRARASKKVVEAQRLLEEARQHYEKMSDYFDDSRSEASKASINVQKILKEM